MDKKYYQLFESCTEAVLMSIAISKNAEAKEAIRTATDPLIFDCIKQATELNMTLQEVMNRQEYANVMSMPG